MEIKDELTEDFIYTNNRLMRYQMGLETMKGDDLPPCFTPVVQPDKLERVVYCMRQTLDAIREAVSDE